MPSTTNQTPPPAGLRGILLAAGKRWKILDEQMGSLDEIAIGSLLSSLITGSVAVAISGITFKGAIGCAIGCLMLLVAVMGCSLGVPLLAVFWAGGETGLYWSFRLGGAIAFLTVATVGVFIFSKVTTRGQQWIAPVLATLIGGIALLTTIGFVSFFWGWWGTALLLLLLGTGAATMGMRVYTTRKRLLKGTALLLGTAFVATFILWFWNGPENPPPPDAMAAVEEPGFLRQVWENFPLGRGDDDLTPTTSPTIEETANVSTPLAGQTEEASATPTLSGEERLATAGVPAKATATVGYGTFAETLATIDAETTAKAGTETAVAQGTPEATGTPWNPATGTVQPPSGYEGVFARDSFFGKAPQPLPGVVAGNPAGTGIPPTWTQSIVMWLIAIALVLFAIGFVAKTLGFAGYLIPIVGTLVGALKGLLKIIVKVVLAPFKWVAGWFKKPQQPTPPPATGGRGGGGATP